MLHVIMKGSRAAASWLTQVLQATLRLCVYTSWSGPLVLDYYLFAMPQSRSKREDSAREKHNMLMVCIAAPQKIEVDFTL